MRVKDVMTRHVTACSLESSMAGAASRMFLAECGAVPVIDRGKRVVGILTDRDICLALAVADRPASEVKAREVITGKIYTCRSDDDLHTALETMRDKHVRRLPVVDDKGRLKGMLSLTDAIRVVRDMPLDEEIRADEVLGTLRSVAASRRPHADDSDLHA